MSDCPTSTQPKAPSRHPRRELKHFITLGATTPQQETRASPSVLILLHSLNTPSTEHIYCSTLLLPGSAQNTRGLLLLCSPDTLHTSCPAGPVNRSCVTKMLATAQDHNHPPGSQTPSLNHNLPLNPAQTPSQLILLLKALPNSAQQDLLNQLSAARQRTANAANSFPFPLCGPGADPAASPAELKELVVALRVLQTREAALLFDGLEHEDGEDTAADAAGRAGDRGSMDEWVEKVRVGA
ncbi:hypothetical protein BDK51DRAFT_49677 [Blyttiomyces helicus]|uniref:Uncharacterized protein n=1 Tax=Blyttiomyces helicus TaxID=388810 RepID=A0A4P9VUJ4_9FUNG|nr:hypothetical protein BDK51DRAFT_49677 [Blyttiomyces helicus]|eukprot:RKO83264.1 hypothetical protein BDK51DRAFT_49677 [Blyttiomyces helicus]